MSLIDDLKKQHEEMLAELEEQNRLLREQSRMQQQFYNRMFPRERDWLDDFWSKMG